MSFDSFLILSVKSPSGIQHAATSSAFVNGSPSAFNCSRISTAQLVVSLPLWLKGLQISIHLAFLSTEKLLGQ